MIKSRPIYQIYNSNLSLNEKAIEIERRTRYYSYGMKEYRMMDKEHIANNYMNELNVHGDYRDQVLNIINNYNLKDLHSRCSEEQIIAIICFYVMSKYNKKIRLEDRRLFKQLDLDYDKVSRVLINYSMSKELDTMVNVSHIKKVNRL